MDLALTLASVLDGVSIGTPLSCGNLTAFPLLRDHSDGATYSLLEDLLDDGRARVTEIDDSGHVPLLKVLNDADVDGFLLDGTELRGAKQNRMVNISIVVGRRSETEIPVSCVEQGRWTYRSQAFTSAKRTAPSFLRSEKARSVRDNLQSSGRAASDQGRVWNRVEQYLHESGAESETMALDAAFEHRGEDSEDFVNALSTIDANGAVVVLNGKILGADLFDSRTTFRKLWPILLRGYALDATLRTTAASAKLDTQQIDTWLDNLREKRTVRRPTPGVGTYFVLEDDLHAGGVLMLGDTVIHAAFFAGSEQNTEPRRDSRCTI